MNTITDFIGSIVNPTQAQVLAYLVSANFVGGILAAVISKQLEIAQVLNIWKRIALIFGSYVAVSVAALAIADFGAMRTAMFAALVAYMGAQIASNASAITGIAIPESIKKYLER